MEEKQTIEWTTGEIGNLWNVYMANSMAEIGRAHV